MLSIPLYKFIVRCPSCVNYFMIVLKYCEMQYFYCCKEKIILQIVILLMEIDNINCGVKEFGHLGPLYTKPNAHAEEEKMLKDE